MTLPRLDWSGQFKERTTAHNVQELASAIADFSRSSYYPRGYQRFELAITPVAHRMFTVRVRPLATVATEFRLMIPVGADRRRRGLLNVGWAIGKTGSGTSYYMRSMRADLSHTLIVAAAIESAYRVTYGDLADQLTWAAEIQPMWIIPGETL